MIVAPAHRLPPPVDLASCLSNRARAKLVTERDKGSQDNGGPVHVPARYPKVPTNPGFDMQSSSFVFVLAAATAAGSLPVLAGEVGVSVSVGQPGFYGRVDIGGYPPPQIIYRHPVVIDRVPAGRPPIYLNVPPGHAKSWRRYCGAYEACGERVYFVRNGWYDREYVPRYQQDRRDERHDEYHGDRRQGHGNRHWGGGREHDQRD